MLRSSLFYTTLALITQHKLVLPTFCQALLPALLPLAGVVSICRRQFDAVLGSRKTDTRMISYCDGRRSSNRCAECIAGVAEGLVHLARSCACFGAELVRGVCLCDGRGGVG